MSEASCNKDSLSHLLFSIVALGRCIGPCLSEYAQTTQDKVDLQTYPSSINVVKAFVADNFVFYDNKNASSRKN
jgi:hypothetical protein